jgi:DNA-binding response OmpR family regulator
MNLVTDTTVLLVERDPVAQQLIAFTLSSAGFDVSIASDPDDARMMTKVLLPDLILVDVRLPDLAGLRLVGELRARELAKDVVIVALMSRAARGLNHLAMDAGCDGYLEKPIVTRSFATEVTRFLSQEASRSA